MKNKTINFAKKNWLYTLLLYFCFLIILFIRKPFYFHYDYNSQNIVNNYLRSQDIYDPKGEIKDRIIISDSEIYLGSGYLYSLGESPAKYNFQHPPLVKYLYGYSLKLFNTPYVLQYVFGFLLLCLVYFLGLKISGDRRISLLASLILIIDPLTSDVFYNTYLDLGQTVFGLGFVASFIFYPSGWLISGILLGLLLAAKFWSLSLFIFLMLLIYRIFVSKNINILSVIKTILVSLIVYSFTYIVFFSQGGSAYDFIKLQFKMVKFMLEHNSIPAFGGQLSLFFTGFYKDWWTGGSIVKSNIWTVLWPISLISLLIAVFIKKLRSKILFLFMIIIGFFTATIKGAPFPRYIIFITPYLYISLAIVIMHYFNKKNGKKESVEKHFDKVAGDYDYYKKKNSFYYDNLKKLLKSLIPTNKNVMEFGCGTGDLLTSLNPKKGIGYDISSEMIKIAKSKHKSNKNLEFVNSFPSSKSIIYNLHSLDHIFMSDVIEHLDDPRKEFTGLFKLINKNTKLIVTMANPIWEPFLMMAEKLKLKMPEGKHKRIVFNDLEKMIKECRLKIEKHDYKLLVPVKIPLITNFANKYLEKPLKKLCFIEYMVIIKS